MKKIVFKKSLFFILLTGIFIINSMAQPRGQGRVQDRSPRLLCLDVPDLTEKQQEKILELRAEQIQESAKHRAEMDKLRAEKRSLMLESTPDSDKLNSVIDEMTQLRAKQLKKNVANRQRIREELTENQRIYFDNYHMNRGRQSGNFQGRGGRGQRW